VKPSATISAVPPLPCNQVSPNCAGSVLHGLGPSPCQPDYAPNRARMVADNISEGR